MRIILFECKGELNFGLEDEGDKEDDQNSSFEAKNGQLVLYGLNEII